MSAAFPFVFIACLLVGTWIVGGLVALVRALFPTHIQMVVAIVAVLVLAISLGFNIADVGHHHPDPDRVCIGPPGENC